MCYYGDGMHHNNNEILEKTKKYAFTLAEVLITLGVIGVVAAMTMPSVINQYKEKENAAKLKKIYSTLSQAYITAISKHESPENWTWSPQAYPIPQTIAGYLIENLQVSKVCIGPECFPNRMYKRLNGVNHTNYYKNGNEFTSFILNDGTSIILWSAGACSDTYKDCAFIYADLNGDAPPNQIGRDFFAFVLTPANIIPFGIEEHSYPFSSACKRNNDSYLNGIGCTAWVIYNENMDYLHCDDLTWNGKIKCK